MSKRCSVFQFAVVFWAVLCLCVTANAANVLYIHGDVAADGTVPSGSAAPYDQMLLDDTGSTGLSQFRTMVQSQGHSIIQRYDRTTTLTAGLLAGYSVVIFGLHQKSWSGSERSALDSWLRNGGGMLIYSDSASGGRFNIVGAQNTVGQTVTNNLIAPYGLQVTVDQADGVRTMPSSSSHPIVSGGLTLEGEGVSPIAVDQSDSSANILVPYTRNVNRTENITITNPQWGALVLKPIGAGHISVMFDRQPMWNNGPGSDINEEDNREILRRLINFLAEAPNSEPSPDGDGVGVVPSISVLLLTEDE
ncbi:MAG: hypothetical protein AAF353_00110 [Pseudomonadota bacterium]